MPSRLWSLLLALVLAALSARAEEPPWAAWFRQNVLVKDKGSYIHVFWNAQDVRARFEGEGRRPLVAAAAWELASRLYPEKATADAIRVDVAFVAQRDTYGLPKWETLTRVAHIELSRSKVAAALAKGARPADLPALFDKLELF